LKDTVNIVNIATAFKNCCYILNNLLNKMGVYNSYGFPWDEYHKFISFTTCQQLFHFGFWAIYTRGAYTKCSKLCYML